MQNSKLGIFILRVGIASVFLYAAVASFLEPQNWIGYLPQFLRNLFPANILLVTFSIYEIILSLWLIWGQKAFYSAILSAATLTGIIIVNLGALDIVFRDIAILFASIALAVLKKDSK